VPRNAHEIGQFMGLQSSARRFPLSELSVSKAGGSKGGPKRRASFGIVSTPTNVLAAFAPALSLPHL